MEKKTPASNGGSSGWDSSSSSSSSSRPSSARAWSSNIFATGTKKKGAKPRIDAARRTPYIEGRISPKIRNPEGTMAQIPQKTNWGPVLALGGLWGLSEAALGMYLRQCASTVSGSVMTGAALFFLAAAWTVSPRAATAAAMVAIAASFTLFAALLLGLPVLHGAIGNPIFAIVMEGAAFVLILGVVSKSIAGKAAGQGLSGG